MKKQYPKVVQQYTGTVIQAVWTSDTGPFTFSGGTGPLMLLCHNTLCMCTIHTLHLVLSMFSFCLHKELSVTPQKSGQSRSNIFKIQLLYCLWTIYY